MAQRKTKVGNITLFMIGAAIFSVSVYFHCFSGQDAAKSFLEDKGYTQVKVSSGNIFSCSEHERATSFTARDPGNKEVSGSVCNPVFLNPSIRLD